MKAICLRVHVRQFGTVLKIKQVSSNIGYTNTKLCCIVYCNDTDRSNMASIVSKIFGMKMDLSDEAFLGVNLKLSGGELGRVKFAFQNRWFNNKNRLKH